MRRPYWVHTAQVPGGLLSLLGIAVVCLSASAVTWHVERDGSGDFVVIQDAVNAAASGDTILLGPGRFDEHGPFMPGTVTIYDAYAGVDDISLTFIGSGQGVTIVGPEVAPFQTQEIGFVLAAESAQTVRIERLTLENLDKGLAAFDIRVLCQDVEFRDSETGAFLYQSVESSFADCGFVNCKGGVGLSTASSNAQIVRCSFDNAYWYAVNCGGGSVGIVIDAITVTNSEFGIGLYQASAVISASSIDVAGNVGLYIESNSSLHAVDTTISSDLLVASVSGGSHLSGIENVFEGGSKSTLEFIGLATADLSNCNIRKGTGPAVYVDSYLTPVDIDLRNNFWGTTDPDSIAAWIIDSNDNHNPPLDPNYGTVLYEPFLLRSIPTATSSMGRLKALFRAQH